MEAFGNLELMVQAYIYIYIRLEFQNEFQVILLSSYANQVGKRIKTIQQLIFPGIKYPGERSVKGKNGNTVEKFRLAGLPSTIQTKDFSTI